MAQANARPQQRFDNEEVARLRSLTVAEALNLLGLFWKVDPDYEPNKSIQSKRLNVSVGNGCFEIIATGEKWYDTRAQRGGGGAIDLTMHLHAETFPKAVKRLRKELAEKPCG